MDRCDRPILIYFSLSVSLIDARKSTNANVLHIPHNTSNLLDHKVSAWPPFDRLSDQRFSALHRLIAPLTAPSALSPLLCLRVSLRRLASSLPPRWPLPCLPALRRRSRCKMADRTWVRHTAATHSTDTRRIERAHKTGASTRPPRGEARATRRRRSGSSLQRTSRLTPLPLAFLAPPLVPAGAAPPPGEGDVEEHEHEYTHSYYPLETKELNLNEQAFINAAQEGLLDQCAQALSNGLVDVDVQDQWGSTALMHAVNKKHTALVTYLLSKRADINKQDYRGITCLMEASWNRHGDMVKLLLKMGANINLTDERDYTALMQAAEEGHHVIVQVGSTVMAAHGRPRDWAAAS